MYTYAEVITSLYDILSVSPATLFPVSSELRVVSLDTAPPPRCHGPECSGSRRVTGSYGRSIGIGELVNTSREHGRSAVSMETMDSYRFICEEGQAQPRRGPSSRSMQMVTTQGLERQEPKEPSPVKEEEQCRRSRHSSGGQEWG
ncbi:uncharacterized protein UDID_17279 [Ustilago sp. UG-2017a]|nr:uncharacterized protein UDID_17279 [Ustilago sp. UG-2017a]